MTRDRQIAAIMARTVMLVAFIGVGVSLVFMLLGQPNVALPVCVGSGVIALLVLLIGGYFVARARE